MKLFFKVLYILTREMNFFSLPILSKIRRLAYSKYFNAEELSVGKMVSITAPHICNVSDIKIGKRVEIGSYTQLDFSGGLVLEDDVTVSEGVKVYTHEHNIHGENVNWRDNGIQYSGITLKQYSWIGANAVITSTTGCVGVGAIVAAGSVVTKSVPDMAIVAGIPARIIGYRKKSNLDVS